MTRLGVVFWGGLVLASGFATFNVKYAVQGIDEELVRVRRQTIAETQEIRVLTAEWAYLNQPDRLAELNRNFLQLAPMTTKQLQGRVDEIALRTPPAGGEATAPPTMLPPTRRKRRRLSRACRGNAGRRATRCLPPRRPPPRMPRHRGRRNARPAARRQDAATATQAAKAAAGATRIPKRMLRPPRRDGHEAPASRRRHWPRHCVCSASIWAGRPRRRGRPRRTRHASGARPTPTLAADARGAETQTADAASGTARDAATPRTRRHWPRRCACSVSMPLGSMPLGSMAAGRPRGCGWPRRARPRSMR